MRKPRAEDASIFRATIAGSRPQASEDDTSYLRAGLSPDLLRKLRRGHWVIGETLDLHGATAHEAAGQLDAFLDECREHGLRCVRVVHGKGLRSAGGEPVLKGRVRALLARHEAVLAFVEPPAAQGGSGAVVVLLAA